MQQKKRPKIQNRFFSGVIGKGVCALEELIIKPLAHIGPPACFFFAVDLICRWTCLCHWAGKDLPLLLPEAQDEGHQFLPRRCVGGADWLAHHRSCAGGLRLFPAVQVRENHSGSSRETEMAD